MVTGPVLATVGAGLLMLLNEQSSSGAWIGYQVVIGIGAGACLTIPMMLSQVMVPEADMAIATAVMICMFSVLSLSQLWQLVLTESLTVFQSTGGAFVLAAAQGVFQNQLVHALHEFAPGIDPITVLSLGATDDALASIPPSTLPGIVSSYVRALRYVFALGIPVSGIAFIVSFFQPWIKYHDPHKKMDLEESGVDEGVEKANDANALEELRD